VDADPAWPALADAEMRRMQLSVPKIDSAASYRDPLERLGYLFVPDPESTRTRRGSTKP
jgi:hypothetical protein